MTIERSKFCSRLTPRQAERIRSAPAAVTHAELARRYRVTATTVARIRRGVTWPAQPTSVLRVRLDAQVVAALELAARAEGRSPEEFAGRLLARCLSRLARSRKGTG